MIVKMLLVDACTDGLFSGGRAAVAILRHLGQEIFLGALADELGFPVTAYILPHQDEFITRCFSPQKGEITAHNFAALAAAHSIYGLGLAPAGKPVVLHGRGGGLSLFKDPAQPEGTISLNLNAVKTTAAAPEVGDQLQDRLGLSASDLLKAEYLGADSLLVCCRTMGAMEGLDFSQLRRTFPKTGLTFSAPLDSSFEQGYAVRGFSAEARPENVPMSLAAHAALGAFWAAHLKKTRLEVHYLSPRPSRLWISQGSGGALVLSGHVNTVFRADPVLKELSGEAAPEAF